MNLLPSMRVRTWNLQQANSGDENNFLMILIFSSPLKWNVSVCVFPLFKCVTCCNEWNNGEVDLTIFHQTPSEKRKKKKKNWKRKEKSQGITFVTFFFISCCVHQDCCKVRIKENNWSGKKNIFQLFPSSFPYFHLQLPGNFSLRKTSSFDSCFIPSYSKMHIKCLLLENEIRKLIHWINGKADACRIAFFLVRWQRQTFHQAIEIKMYFIFVAYFAAIQCRSSSAA